MYLWIWRRLPGGVIAKLAGSLVLFLAVVALLLFVVFPWAEPLLPFDDVQVGTTTGQESGPDAAVPGDESDAPEEIPYSTHSNDPEPTPSR